MPMRRRQTPANHLPLPADVFASGFDLQDFEDWVRLVCYADQPDGRDGPRPGWRAETALVIPRSSLHRLIETLRYSAAPRPDHERHS